MLQKGLCFPSPSNRCQHKKPRKMVRRQLCLRTILFFGQALPQGTPMPPLWAPYRHQCCCLPQLTSLCSFSPAQITTRCNFTQVNRATLIHRWPRSSTAKKKGPPVLTYRMVLSWDGALCLLGSAAAACFGLHLVASKWICPRAANRAISTDPTSTDPKASGTKTF